MEPDDPGGALCCQGAWATSELSTVWQILFTGFEKSSTLNLTGGCADLDHFGEPFCAESDIFPDLLALNLTCILIRDYKNPSYRSRLHVRAAIKEGAMSESPSISRPVLQTCQIQRKPQVQQRAWRIRRKVQRWLPVLMLRVCAESDTFGLIGGIRNP